MAEVEDRAAAPFYVKRSREHWGETVWLVVDSTSGEEVGRVFKYIGSWWANHTAMENRRGTKAEAAQVAWQNRRSA